MSYEEGWRDHDSRDDAIAAARAAPEACDVTLATLRDLVERTLATPAGTGVGRGYWRAMQDVKAVLDKHGAPPDEPAHYGEQP